MINEGFAFHRYHDRLVDYIFDQDKWRDAIIKNTPSPENRELHLRLFKLIPNHRVPTKLIWAKRNYDEVVKTYIKARRDDHNAWEAYRGGNSLKFRAWKALSPKRAEEIKRKWVYEYDNLKRVEKDRDEAWHLVLKTIEDCMPTLVRLHSELCPNCPWDEIGKSIFNKKKGRQKNT